MCLITRQTTDVFYNNIFSLHKSANMVEIDNIQDNVTSVSNANLTCNGKN